MYKVFINDRAITLTDNYGDYTSAYDCLFVHYGSSDGLKESIELLQTSQVVKELCVYADDLEKLWADFSSKYEMIHAAGGIVKHDGKVLMIMKNAHWDLPKGKIDGSESLEDAAKREVGEECGLDSLNIEDSLGTTYYLFRDNDKLVLKKTDWFLMSSESDGPLKGDEKEGITDVQWVSAADWENKSAQSYPSVIKLLSTIF